MTLPVRVFEQSRSVWSIPSPDRACCAVRSVNRTVPRQSLPHGTGGMTGMASRSLLDEGVRDAVL